MVLVTPIDASAPKGRMILPQVQAIRDILDAGAVCSVTQPEQLPGVLSGLSAPPRLVITDSQAFGRVKGMVPGQVPLTSFFHSVRPLQGGSENRRAGRRSP